jgi:hypothetical protein
MIALISVPFLLGLVLATEKFWSLRLKNLWAFSFGAEYYYLVLKSSKPFESLELLKFRFSLTSNSS